MLITAICSTDHCYVFIFAMCKSWIRRKLLLLEQYRFSVLFFLLLRSEWCKFINRHSALHRHCVVVVWLPFCTKWHFYFSFRFTPSQCCAHRSVTTYCTCTLSHTHTYDVHGYLFVFFVVSSWRRNASHLLVQNCSIVLVMALILMHLFRLQIQ